MTSRRLAVFLYVGASVFAIAAFAVVAEWVRLVSMSSAHDSYYVVPGTMLGVIVFGIGLVLNVISRGGVLREVDLGSVRGAHLAGTIALVAVWLTVQSMLSPERGDVFAPILCATLILLLLSQTVALFAAGIRLSALHR